MHTRSARSSFLISAGSSCQSSSACQQRGWSLARANHKSTTHAVQHAGSHHDALSTSTTDFPAYTVRDADRTYHASSHMRHMPHHHSHQARGWAPPSTHTKLAETAAVAHASSPPPGSLALSVLQTAHSPIRALHAVADQAVPHQLVEVGCRWLQA